MMSDTAIAIEFAANTPIQAERLVLENMTVRDGLKRILQRFGLSPIYVVFRAGTEPDGDVLMFGRDRVTNKPAPFGRILFGAALAEIEAAKQSLIDANWQPVTPRFSMVLPDGRDVSTPTDGD
jgi:hypothetical protein